MFVFFILFVLSLVLLGGYALSVIRGLGRWNRSYQRLSKRYGGTQSSGGVLYGYLLSSPSLMFDYGRTFCVLKNRKSFRFSGGRQTELTMTWPDKKIKLDVSTSPTRGRSWGPGAMKKIEMESPQFQADFYVATNQPRLAKKIMSESVQWNLEQLRQITDGNITDGEQVQVAIRGGSLQILKPGYLKDHESIDRFLRQGLDLFDQMMLTYSVGIRFLHEGEATVVADAKCPICSEAIQCDWVVCKRCKTPHCLDCWQYNGQCATFACSEKDYTVCRTHVARVSNTPVTTLSDSKTGRLLQAED